MVSLMSSKSWASMRSALSDTSNVSAGSGGQRSPTHSVSSTSSNFALSSSGSSSRGSINSLDLADEENKTIKFNNPVVVQRRSQEDLRQLAVSTNITELQYAISDIQTRIFEIQELRHQSQSSSNKTTGASNIDAALSSLDERLEVASQGIKAVTESLDPVPTSAKTPTQAMIRSDSEQAVLSRKHGALLEEWAAVQREADLLREELREDKWLTVFRTVTDQADGMMNSLDKAINRCQDFLRQMNSGEPIPPSLWPPDPDRSEGVAPSIVEIFIALVDTFEAKKRHYIPATNKVLSILDKGVQDRVTKNGECLRRHAESTQRWKALNSRLARTDAEMDQGRLYLLSGESAPSDAGSSASGSTGGSSRHLKTPGSSQSGKQSLSLSRSISPLRKIARKFKSSADPETPSGKLAAIKTPASEPNGTLRRQRTTIFGIKSLFPASPSTPEKMGHRQTQSVAHETPPRRSLASETNSNTLRKGLGPMKDAPAWNSSTKVEDSATRAERERTATVRPTPPRRPSAMGFYQSLALSPGQTTPGKRSLSRSSMASSSITGSSRPWSPITTNTSSGSSIIPPLPNLRPPSRSYGQISSPSSPHHYIPAPPTTPRSRPKTPSAIPVPRTAPARIPSGKPNTGTPERNPQAANSYFPDTPSRSQHPPRPPSRSMIPVPSLSFNSASRPGTAMSGYERSDSSMSFRGNNFSFARSASTAPPSAFRDAKTPGGVRPGSRGGGSRLAGPMFGTPMHPYRPLRGPSDPLDAAVASVANCTPHAFTIERVDPPLRTPAPSDTEQRATYAFSTALGRKQLPLKFTAPGKTGERRLLYRAGGGWNDLKEYLLAHPA